MSMRKWYNTSNRICQLWMQGELPKQCFKVETFLRHAKGSSASVANLTSRYYEPVGRSTESAVRAQLQVTTKSIVVLSGGNKVFRVISDVLELMEV